MTQKGLNAQKMLELQKAQNFYEKVVVIRFKLISDRDMVVPR